MATLPSATTTVQQTTSVLATGTDLVCLIVPCATSADVKPRIFGSAAAMFAQHGYCDGLEYAAFHVQETRKPVLVVGIPIVTAGAIQREDKAGNSGSSVTTLTAGGSGILGEHDGAVRVKTGGTIGTDQILLEYSLDGQRTWKAFRLGTANTFAIPYIGATMAFGAGALVAGDVIHTWHGTAPRGDNAGWSAARAALAAQSKAFRSALVFGDLQNSTEAGQVRDQANAYETSNQRFTRFVASVYDQAPNARFADAAAAMTGAPNLTFAASGETITRDAGSWLDDGVRAGDIVTVAGSASNNGSFVVVSPVTNAVLTVASGLADEADAVGVSVTRHTGVAFADVGNTVTRSRGSWISEGFRVGDSVTVAGTSGGTNDGTFTVSAVTAAVLTLSAVAADEKIRGSAVAITNAGAQTKAAWMAEIDAAFASIDGEPRICLSAGRARKTHPFSGWYMRRPAFWAAAIREYQHDVHVAAFRKDLGATGWDLNDADNNLVEWDDLVDGAAGSAARFTTMRTWANGPDGAFIALDLTRAGDSSLLQGANKADVVNLACATVQLNTENAVIGVDFVLNADGTATKDSIAAAEHKVNSALEKVLLQDNKGEGQRASRAVWAMDPSTNLAVPVPAVKGALDLLMNADAITVDTSVNILSGS